MFCTNCANIAKTFSWPVENGIFVLCVHEWSPDIRIGVMVKHDFEMKFAFVLLNGIVASVNEDS